MYFPCMDEPQIASHVTTPHPLQASRYFKSGPHSGVSRPLMQQFNGYNSAMTGTPFRAPYSGTKLHETTFEEGVVGISTGETVLARPSPAQKDV